MTDFVKAAIKDQYHAALSMLKEAIEVCPEDVWISGVEPRTFWRIAYHALYYTHWYLHPNFTHAARWELDRKGCSSLETKPSKANRVPYTRAQILDYWAIVDAFVDPAVDEMDLNAEKCGFWWYSMPKLNHQLMNIRHIQQHTGQLSEILMSHGIDTGWLGTSGQI